MNRVHGSSKLALIVLLACGMAAEAEESSGGGTAKRVPAHSPQLKSNSVLVLDAETSDVLYSRQAERAAPIASITKLMTAIVVLEGGQPLDEMITITEADTAKGRGVFSRLAIGTKLSRGDLLHLALMSSENRAAHAVGRAYPGGLKAFVRAMNAKAKALGMKSAQFVDPTGLSSGNVASPIDLSKLVIAASRNEMIQEYSTDDSHVVQVGNLLLEYRNTDSLVENPAWEIVVQKTGYIAAAGRCLVLNTIIEGRAVVIVLLNSFGKYTRTADAKRVKTWMESAFD